MSLGFWWWQRGRRRKEGSSCMMGQVLWTLVIKEKEKPDVTHCLGTSCASPHMVSLNSLS